MIVAAMIFGASLMFGTNQVVLAGSDLAGSEAIGKGPVKCWLKRQEERIHG